MFVSFAIIISHSVFFNDLEVGLFDLCFVWSYYKFEAFQAINQLK